MSASDFRSYYESQLGGQLPVFRGGLQRGAGLGDILRGIFRYLAPMALRGLSTFAGSTLAAHQAGAPLAAAARSAIMPTISSIAGSRAPLVADMLSKVIPGLRVKSANSTADDAISTRSGYSGNDPPTKQGGGGMLFDGVNGIPTHVRSTQQYKKTSIQSPSNSRKRTAASEGKTKQHAKVVHYNF
jgi:hypothetical protein